MAKDSHTTNMTVVLQSLHAITSKLPDRHARRKLLRFAAANSHKPLKEFLAHWERLEKGRTIAETAEKARRERVISDHEELVKRGDIVVKVTGVSGKGQAGEVKR